MIEYKLVAATAPLNEDQLNDFGKEWWSLITIIKFEDVYWNYFSRMSGVEGDTDG